MRVARTLLGRGPADRSPVRADAADAPSRAALPPAQTVRAQPRRPPRRRPLERDLHRRRGQRPRGRPRRVSGNGNSNAPSVADAGQAVLTLRGYRLAWLAGRRTGRYARKSTPPRWPAEPAPASLPVTDPTRRRGVRHVRIRPVDDPAPPRPSAGRRAPHPAASWSLSCRPGACPARAVSTTLENEAIATVENEATQTDWMGDLSGGLGFDPAAGCGRCSAASGRAGSGGR